MGSPSLFPPGSEQELLALRRRCASALWTLVPRSAGRLFFGGTATSWLAGCLSSTPRSGPVTNTNNNNKGGDKGEGVGEREGECQGVDDNDDNDNDNDHLDAQIINEIETDILDVFSDPYCNKHLMYGALELVLVRVMPELAEKGTVELWEERMRSMLLPLPVDHPVGCQAAAAEAVVPGPPRHAAPPATA